MNISPLLFDCTNGYDGTAVEIYVSGCTRNCKGCHNPEMQSFNYGKLLDTQALLDELNNHKDWFDIISVLGGDLLCNYLPKSLDFTRDIQRHFPDKKLWLFTGAELSEVPQWCLELYDVIKTGTYEESLRQSTGLASSNQRINRKGSEYL